MNIVVIILICWEKGEKMNQYLQAEKDLQISLGFLSLPTTTFLPTKEPMRFIWCILTGPWKAEGISAG